MSSPQKILSTAETTALYGVHNHRRVTQTDIPPQDDKYRGSDPKADIFNKPALLDRMMSDNKLAEKIMDTFLEDIHRRVIIIKQALGSGDAHTISAQAHTIRNSSSSIGATALAEVAYQIEVAGQWGNLIKIGSLVSKIDEYSEILKIHWLNRDFKRLISFYDNFNCRR